MDIKEWLPDNELGQIIWEKKYRYNNETLDEWFDRVSNGNEDIKRLIIDKKFLFGGRILSNRNLDRYGIKTTLSNCYVLSVDDNIESIYSSCADIARTYSYGGGVGIDISKLRPRGAKVHNSAKETTGAVSFMKTFDTVTGTIGQNGRRGALMISMDVRHPDIREFIDVKRNTTEITNANISVRVNDKFMNCVQNDSDYYLFYPCETDIRDIDLSYVTEYDKLYCIDDDKKQYAKKIKAKDLFMRLCENNWNYGEPGILFWDAIKEGHLMSDNKEFEYAGVNPCFSGDTLILTDNGEKRIDSLVGQKVNIWNGFEWSEVEPNITGYNQPMLNIAFSNGKKLRCTTYHKFILADGSRIKAKDLTLKTELSDFYYPDSKDKIKVSIISIKDGGVEDVVYCFNEPKNHSGVFNGIMTGQCAEAPLPNGGSCLLGSINLSAYVKDGIFNYDEFKKDVRTSVIGLNGVLEDGYELHPLAVQKENAKKYKQIGLGIMGLADALIKMQIGYGSKESIAAIDKIMKAFTISAYETSCDLNVENIRYDNMKSSAFYHEAIEPFIDEKYKKKYPLNSQLLACAPTGSLSSLLNISGGCEPIYALSYTRTTKSLHNGDVTYKVYPEVVDDYFKGKGIEKKLSLLPEYFNYTAQKIRPFNRILVQSKLQEYFDASISSTINLPNNATIQDVYDIYLDAWNFNLKGITIFRDGCKRDGILNKQRNDINTTKSIIKRPDVLDADYYQTKIKGEVFCVIVGLLNNKPYEVFAFKVGNDKNLPNHKGKIIKVKKRYYRYHSDYIDIDNLILSTDNIEEKAATLYSSMLMRHGADLEYIIKTAKKVNDNITSFSSAMCRVLSKYLDNKEIKGEICPECGSKLIRENGCVHCASCGWSKCG